MSNSPLWVFDTNARLALKFNKFLNKNADTVAQNRMLKFLVGVFGFCSIANLFLNWYAINYHRDILIPSSLTEKAMVSGTDFDESYVIAFARDVVNLTFTFTPGNVKSRYEQLLMLYSPECFPAGKAMLYDLAERVALTRLTSVFHPHVFRIDQKNRTIEITGNRIQNIDNQVVSNGVTTLSIVYSINHGKFSVCEITDKADTTAAAATAAKMGGTNK